MALSWFGIFFIQPRSLNGDEVGLLAGVFNPTPEAVKSFVGCPNNQLAFISKPCKTPEEAFKEMGRTMETMGIGELWHPGPFDRMRQLPDIIM